MVNHKHFCTFAQGKGLIFPILKRVCDNFHCAFDVVASWA